MRYKILLIINNRTNSVFYNQLIIVMSKQKKELSNGIRLENASWRTWAKQKYNLKTVNPKKLNW